MTTDDLYDINFDWDGASSGVLPDVSMSEPPAQPTTATGNGTGYYVDNNWQSALFGTIGTALNYAILRDQQQIAQKTGTVYAGMPLAATPAAANAAADKRLLMLGVIGIGVALVLKGGK